jgi:tripartite-type tricarboxylate transporter receptor subunit TctC
MKPVRRFVGVVVAAAALVMAHAGAAQDFPAKPVRVVVPFLAGGSVDALARILGAKLGDYWGKPVVVENKPGAGGNIGSLAVVQSDPDGHTLLFSPGGPLSYNASLYSAMPYDPATALEPITLVGRSPNFLIVGKDSPLKSLAELIAAAKAQPGKLNFGSQGNGTSPHLAGAMLANRAGIEVIHVPYRGFPPLIADLVAGNLAFVFADAPNTLPQLRNGQIRVLAVALTERTNVLPEAPSMAEAGMPDFASVAWFGLAAPAKTPSAIISKINADVLRALKEPEVLARFAPLGIEIVGTTPEAAKQILAGEAKSWGEVIRRIGVKAE